uniref:Candidate secreted effector n=1 Tax=Meloidogyne incognita TaxID=6306 RepID=A0A914M8U2_MELIC
MAATNGERFPPLIQRNLCLHFLFILLLIFFFFLSLFFNIIGRTKNNIIKYPPI